MKCLKKLIVSGIGVLLLASFIGIQGMPILAIIALIITIILFLVYVWIFWKDC